MNIKGINRMTIPQIQDEVTGGGKFVRFSYCISLLVVSFKLSSDVYFIRRSESVFVKGLPFSVLTLVFGWWGIPFGIVYTPVCLFTNLRGGKDVTGEMMKILHRYTCGHVFDFEKTEVRSSAN